WLRITGNERGCERHVANDSASRAILLIGIGIEAEDDRLTAAERSGAARRHEQFGVECASFGYECGHLLSRRDRLARGHRKGGNQAIEGRGKSYSRCLAGIP